MNEAELVEKLCSASESDAVALNVLTEAILRDCREPSRAIIGEWLKDNGTNCAKAAFVAGQMHELALNEILNQVEAVSPDLRVDLMTTVVDTVFQLRTLLVEQLEPLLRDLRPLDSADLTRTCDVAYILIRKVVGQAKDKAAERSFGDLSEDDRDREIAEWKEARARMIAAADEI